MEKLRTKSGKEFDVDFFSVITSPQMAYINIHHSSIPQVASVFSDNSETEQLWCGMNYIAGYTRLVSIVPQDNAIRVGLAKE